MITIYWIYKGYGGDEYYFDDEKLVAKYAPNSRSVGIRRFSWLNQLGFGPGYYNNSGVYFTCRKSVFKTEADRDAALALIKKWDYNTEVLADDVAFADRVKALRVFEKRMNKQHPY
jgi:hypothetical protein